jgi:hypothetical protein
MQRGYACVSTISLSLCYMLEARRQSIECIADILAVIAEPQRNIRRLGHAMTWLGETFSEARTATDSPPTMKKKTFRVL